MPTNLPPEYFNAEEAYRAASSIDEKIAGLEAMLSSVPKHKGTDKLRADLRRKLSKLRDASQTKKGAARQLSPYHIDRQGAGQVVVIGPPNTGKSSLVDALTNATPEVAPYPFTTWTPTPGMMPVENIQIQLIDTPPLNREHVEPEMLNLIRRADLMLLVIDLQDYPLEQIEDALAFLAEHRIYPRRHIDRYEREPGMAFRPILIAVNKTDEGLDEDFEVLNELLEEEWPLVPVAAAKERHFDRLKWAVYDRLKIIRIYSKPPGEKPDLEAPFVLKKGSTVEELAGKIHRDLPQTLKSARLWGSAEHDGQMVARDHILEDGDVIELHT